MSEEKRDKWEMPKPVFRQSGGYLPKGFIKKEEVSWDDTAEPNRPIQAAPVAAVHDPQNDMLITMYAPPSDLAAQSILESENEPETPKAPAAPAATPAIEDQPGISETFTVDKAAVPAPVQAAKPKGSGRLLLSFGILVLLAVAAGIGAVIYYFYYISSAANNNN